MKNIEECRKAAEEIAELLKPADKNQKLLIKAILAGVDLGRACERAEMQKAG